MKGTFEGCENLWLSLRRLSHKSSLLQRGNVTVKSGSWMHEEHWNITRVFYRRLQIAERIYVHLFEFFSMNFIKKTKDLHWIHSRGSFCFKIPFLCYTREFSAHKMLWNIYDNLINAEEERIKIRIAIEPGIILNRESDCNPKKHVWNFQLFVFVVTQFAALLILCIFGKCFDGWRQRKRFSCDYLNFILPPSGASFYFFW